MAKGIQYDGGVGNPANNADGEWWTDETRAVGDGIGEVPTDRAKAYVAGGHFKLIDIAPPPAEKKPTPPPPPDPDTKE